MKKKVLLTSLMSIAMLASIASGATYALFTAEDSVNVAVNAGKVSVSAIVDQDSLKTYSLGVEQKNGTFENGGSADFTKENYDLSLDLLTPGDRATFTVKIDNNSNVKIKYRVKLSIEGELASGLVSKAVFDGKEYALTNGATRWFSLGQNEDIPDVTIDLELPLEAGNEYQDKSATIKIAVEAVQGNAEVYDEWDGTANTSWYDASKDEYVIYTAEELAGFAKLVNGTAKAKAVDTFAGKTVKLGSNIDLMGINWTPIGNPMSDDFVGFAGTFDGNGYTISNLTVDNDAAWGQGLFGYNANKTTTIKNFTINNVNINTADTSGAAGGYFQFGTFENIAVTGDVAITGVEHMGGIVGNGYYTNISGCSVIANEGSYITATSHSFAAGIVGYHGGQNYVIEDCSVKNLEITAYGAVGVISGIAGNKAVITNCSGENVVLNKTSEETLPSIGLVVGTWDGSEDNCNITITNNTFDGITLNGKHLAYEPFNILVGSNYGGGTHKIAGTIENNVYENITNNLEVLVRTIKVTTEQEFIDAISFASGELVIDATGLTLSFTNNVEYRIPTGVTVKGARFYSTNRGGNVAYTIKGDGKKVVFDGCIFDRNSMSYLMILGSDGTCEEMEFNNCEFKGAFNLSFYNYDQGKATYNNCKFTSYDNKYGYIVCIAGNQYFYNCSFDYSNALANTDMGDLKNRAVNASGTDGRNSYVELNGCTLKSTSTHNQGGGKVVKK